MAASPWLPGFSHHRALALETAAASADLLAHLPEIELDLYVLPDEAVEILVAALKQHDNPPGWASGSPRSRGTGSWSCARSCLCSACSSSHSGPPLLLLRQSLLSFPMRLVSSGLCCGVPRAWRLLNGRNWTCLMQPALQGAWCWMSVTAISRRRKLPTNNLCQVLAHQHLVPWQLV